MYHHCEHATWYAQHELSVIKTDRARHWLKQNDQTFSKGTTDHAPGTSTVEDNMWRSSLLEIMDQPIARLVLCQPEAGHSNPCNPCQRLQTLSAKCEVSTAHTDMLKQPQRACEKVPPLFASPEEDTGRKCGFLFPCCCGGGGAGSWWSGNFLANLKIHSPKNYQPPYRVAKRGGGGGGGSKPFSKICQGKQAASQAKACNGISPKRCGPAAAPCALSTTERKIAAQPQWKIVSNHLIGVGGGVGGLKWSGSIPSNTTSAEL